MLTESMQHAQDDKEARKLAEARIEAESLLNAISAALAVDSQLLNATERTAIEDAIATMQAQAITNDANAIAAATEALNKVTSDFAARRMDSAVQKGLTGHKLTELG